MSPQPTKIALIAKGNSDLFLDDLRASLARTMKGDRFQLFTPPFDQSTQQIVDDHSPLYRFAADITLFLDFFEDFYDPYFNERSSLDGFHERYKDHLELGRASCRER